MLSHIFRIILCGIYSTKALRSYYQNISRTGKLTKETPIKIHYYLQKIVIDPILQIENWFRIMPCAL